MHGSFWRSHCMKSGREYSYDQLKEKLFVEDVPKSDAGGVIKPDIVFFGENVHRFNESVQLVAASDLLLVIGTSCVVYPAASLPQMAGGKIAVINFSPVDVPADNVVLQINDDIDTVFGELEPHVCP